MPHSKSEFSLYLLITDANGVEVVIAVRLDEVIRVDDGVEANGAGARRDVAVAQELAAKLDQLENDLGDRQVN